VFSQVTTQKIQEELHLAGEASSAGNKGKARVCARRAAGVAVREYLAKRQISYPDPSSIAVLTLIRDLPGLPDSIKINVDNLLLRVNPDYQLPVDVDLVDQARQLINTLGNLLGGNQFDS